MHMSLIILLEYLICTVEIILAIIFSGQIFEDQPGITSRNSAMPLSSTAWNSSFEK